MKIPEKELLILKLPRVGTVVYWDKYFAFCFLFYNGKNEKREEEVLAG